MSSKLVLTLQGGKAKPLPVTQRKRKPRREERKAVAMPILAEGLYSTISRIKSQLLSIIKYQCSGVSTVIEKAVGSHCLCLS